MYNTILSGGYVMTVLCMLAVDIFLVKRLSGTEGFGKRHRWILVMLVACVVCLLSDALCVVIGDSGNRILNFSLNAVFDFSFAFAAYYLFEYVERMYAGDTERNRAVVILCRVPIILNGILILTSYWTGWVFAVDGNGIYSRGPLYGVFFVVLANGYTELSLLLILIRSWKHNDAERKKQLHASFMYILPIMLGTWFQVFIMQFPGSSIGLTVTMIFIFLNNQEELLRLSRQQLEDRNRELEEALNRAELNNEIIGAISKIYYMIYRMDLTEGIYEEVSAGTQMHELTGKSGNIRETFEEARKKNIAPEYQSSMKRFLDVTTLSDRLGSGESIAEEYKATSGEWCLARFIVKKRDETGRVTHVLYAVRVITGQKTKELEYQRQMLLSAEDARKANLAKTDFLRRMSHDIRTPINGIIGILNIANHYPEDLEKQTECRAKIKDASQFLLELVNNILDMNKLESGKVVLEHRAFDMRRLLQELKSVTQVNAQEYSVAVQVEAFDAPHRYLLGSPLHLRQVLQNITGNATKYNVPGGRILLSCREVAVQDGFATYELVCKDTGRGMSRQFQKHAFEAFSQEDSGARTTFTGTGLGLAITKQLVELMGGHLDMESRLGEGTTFTLTQTFEIDTEHVAEKEQQEDSSLEGIHVLLVEDNELNMEIAQFMLENNGLRVTPAWNGQEAVNLFAGSQPGEFDLILMDVMMPVMDGLTATRELRALEREDAAAIPVFAMTANAFQDDIEQSRRAGMTEHLTKPLQEEELLRAIRRHVGKNRGEIPNE